MRERRTWVIDSAMLLAACGLATAVMAQSLPKLPQDWTFPQSADSPGVVTFSHTTHLAVQERPDCTACHPRLFRMLEPGTPVEGRPILHARMEQGRQCGSCHNGEAATGLDDCAHCHRMA